MTTIYKSKLHAASAFARRYLISLGGSWFLIGGRKLQGLHEVYRWIEKKGYVQPWCDGRIEMVYEILDHCITQRSKTAGYGNGCGRR
jgi:hypothetical protein